MGGIHDGAAYLYIQVISRFCAKLTDECSMLNFLSLPFFLYPASVWGLQSPHIFVGLARPPNVHDYLLF